MPSRDAAEVNNYVLAMEHGLGRGRYLPLLVQLAVAHYQFEAIHPFLDGDGRSGRLLIPPMLVLRDALPQPLLYLSAYFEQHRSERS